MQLWRIVRTMEDDLLRGHKAAIACGITDPTRPREERSSTETVADCAASTAVSWPTREQAVRVCIATMIRHGRKNPKMKRNHAVHAVSAAVMLAFTALFAGQVHAACEKSKRMQHYNAECLEASYKNRGWLKDSYAKAKNKCTEYGKVVAKVDIRHSADQTWDLNDGNEREYKNDWQHIRGVFCCTDLSDLCNKSDIVNTSSCNQKFRESPASATCADSLAIGINEKAECVFNTNCDGGLSTTVLAVAWPDAADLYNCNGTLTLGSC